MKRLSKPITALRSHYEVVIVGSGYGGSIAASRFARAGRQVCLLEKGREFRPGEYPWDIGDAQKEIQLNTEKGHSGNRVGLYEFYMGKEMMVFKGCGLGGTSNVNANVSIEPEPRVFEDTRWPKAFRDNMQPLYDGFAEARAMLKPSPYPEGSDGFPELAKAKGMKLSASAMKEKFRYADINVNFEYDHEPNHVGITQKKCINCGDCVTGCNHHAKNTLIMNYLPDAVSHGAEIFCEAGVKYVRRHNNQWQVFFNICNLGRDKFDAPLLFITADKVILSAGALGSTEILLRSNEQGLKTSKALGKYFTGNGDVLGFAYNNDIKVNGIGLGRHFDDASKEPVGPCITGIIDMRQKAALEDGMTFEEGTIPGPVATALTPMLISLSKVMSADTDDGWDDRLAEKKREMQSLIEGPYKGAMNNTQVYLVMTHDDGNGVMQMANDRLELSWPDVGRQKIFEKVNNKLKEAAKALGGSYMPNPQWNELLNYDLVTVHPMGGCIMGDDAANSVTNDIGQVYSGTSGSDVHPGLYVMDGAIIPRPLGTNPLLTISAVSERNCKMIIEESKLVIDYAMNPSAQPLKDLEAGISFTETMRGFISLDETSDYRKAYKAGQKSKSPFEFTLTIQSQHIESFATESAHRAEMIGTVHCPALSKFPITANDGIFNLFIKEGKESRAKLMIYKMTLNTQEGNAYFFDGFKEIKNDSGFDMWNDTTTLYITVYELTTKKVLGKGMLKIAMADFIKQLGTMRAINVDSAKESADSVSKFGKLFAGELWESFI